MTTSRGSSAVGRPAGRDEAATALAAGGADAVGAVAAPGPPAAVVPSAAAPETEPAAYERGPAWALWLPPALALLISLWNITTPSYWRDEAATIAAIRRPLGDLIRMLGNVDAVHGAYYLLMWP